MEADQRLQPGGKAVAPARQESPRSESGEEPQLRHPEVSSPPPRTPARPFLLAGSAVCAPSGRSPDAFSVPARGPFPRGGCPRALAASTCLLGGSEQAGREARDPGLEKLGGNSQLNVLCTPLL